MMPRMGKSALPCLLGALLLAAGCSKQEPAGEREASAPMEHATRVPDGLQKQVRLLARQTCDTTAALTGASQAFVDAPDVAKLETARQHWQTAHARYQSLAFGYRLAGLAMPQEKNDRDPIDAHRQLPGYLDQVPGYPHSGLAYSEVPLTPAHLRKEHQSIDFYYLTLGFHPLEALLWPAGESDPQATVERFTGSTAPESDEVVDAPARRQALLRVIAGELKRDASALCSTGNEAYLVTGLAPLLEDPRRFMASLDEALGATLGTALDALISNPDAEDRNGMPLLHSPQAGTDITEYRRLIADIRQQWLPMGLPNSEVRAPIDQALNELAARLEAIDPMQRPLDTEALTAARQQLDRVSQRLSTGGDAG